MSRRIPITGARAAGDTVASYAGPLDRCTAGGEQGGPQPGGVCGGSITSDLAGPFKPGSMGW